MRAIDRHRSRRRAMRMLYRNLGFMILITFAILTLIRLDYILKTQQDIAETVTDMQTEQSIDLLEKTPSRGDMRPTSLGEFEITYYDACIKCCSKTDGITATGTQATVGRTIAVDPKVIALGSTVWIDGHQYIAEDVGGAIKDKHIDIFVTDHAIALQLGRQTKEVYQYAKR